MAKRRAFTLLELLVVVGILGILLVMLFPAYTEAKKKGRNTRCMHNMRVLAAAVHDYAADNDQALPPDASMNANSASAVLNPYLKTDSYGVLECPSDRGSDPAVDNTRFVASGTSYIYNFSGSQGISNVVGTVTWQEEALGYMAIMNTTLLDFRNAFRYYQPGPETIGDENSGYWPPPGTNNSYSAYVFDRGRDVTQAEIDGYWASYLAFLTGQIKGGVREGFNLSLSQSYHWKRKGTADAGHGGQDGPPKRHNTGDDWYDQSAGGRTVDRINYWKNASKKVCLVDGDGALAFSTPAASESYPKTGMGFWHGYGFVPDPLAPTDKSKYHVKIHAAFLDGHAEAIEFNMFRKDSSGNYLDKCPIHPHLDTVNDLDKCSGVHRDHPYY